MLLKEGHPPRGLFKGQNVMTPEIIGYYKIEDGYAELSKGRGIYNDVIYGVTVRPEPSDWSARRSRLCHSLSEAMSYIEELSCKS